jgi:hypothetical protein
VYWRYTIYYTIVIIQRGGFCQILYESNVILVCYKRTDLIFPEIHNISNTDVKYKLHQLWSSFLYTLYFMTS